MDNLRTNQVPIHRTLKSKEDDASARVFREVWQFFQKGSWKNLNFLKTIFWNLLKFRSWNWALSLSLWVYTNNYHSPKTSRHQGNNCPTFWPNSAYQFSSTGEDKLSTKFWCSTTNYGCPDCPQVHPQQHRHTHSQSTKVSCDTKSKLKLFFQNSSIQSYKYSTFSCWNCSHLWRCEDSEI